MVMLFMRIIPLVIALSAVSLAGFLGTTLASWSIYDNNVDGRIERAVRATDIEVAYQELQFALEHLHANGLTEGTTSIWGEATEDEQIRPWFNRLQEHVTFLEQARSGTTDEQHAVMSALNELVSFDGNYMQAISPPGIYKFPYNGLYASWGWISFVLILICLFCICRYAPTPPPD